MAEGKYDDQISKMLEQINQLQRENQDMQRALTEVANANVLPTVLQHGFDSVIAELRPLRDLTPSRQPLDKDAECFLGATLTAIKGVTLTGGSLGITEVNVPFIGQKRTDVKCEHDSGGEPQPYAGQPDPYKTDPYKTDPAKTDTYKTELLKTDPYKTPNQPIDKPRGGGYRP